ncbi:MAG: serine hydrolase domain-containing protein [Myxococcota bacterium]
MRLFALLALALFLSTPTLAQSCPSRDVWPQDDWAVNLVDPQAKAAEIQALEEFAFTLTGEDGERLGLRTNALLIIKGGRIVYEKYARGFDASKRHLSWSVAKSVTSALAGVAVAEGALSLEDSICKHFPEYAGLTEHTGEVCRIRVKDVLTFTTGLDWTEEYEDKTYQVSSVIAMLFGVGHKDMLGHILSHPLVATPGEKWLYSTGDGQLLSAVVKRALEKDHGRDAFWKYLFEPIGMKRVVLEEDLKGTPLGGSMVYATPRDFARFGYLYLNDGCWNGTRILPQGWVTASRTISEAYPRSPVEEDTPCGYMWWLNQAVPEKSQEKPWPDAPDDTYAAMGHWGQRVVVIPSEDVVIVRTADDREGSVPLNELIKLSLGVAR